MKDADIRSILIEFLTADTESIRIYQEKLIGDAVCDVMSVTDCLTGYEIKSDADNYNRLSNQIDCYSKYFDYNYIVVTKKHRKNIVDIIPDEWGIITVGTDFIQIDRKAKINDNVSRRNQLSILWKLELKNILVKNNMPMFAQKNKNYIAGQIFANIESRMLGRQIAEELMNRDYSVYNAEDYTIKKEHPQLSCVPELVDMLSEEDITLDKWLQLYQQAKTIRKQKEAEIKNSFHRTNEHQIKYTEISVSLGASWISKSIIEDFIDHILDLDNTVCRVSYEYVTGSWFVSDKKFYNDNLNCTSKYGTERYNALQIIEATLNLREIKIFDYEIIFNESETIAVLEKQKLIISEFNDWIWQDEDRIWEVEEAYNKMFAGLERKMYDGRKLKFPQMSSDYRLYDYQKDAVQRIISENNTLLAFDVGAGKTYIMITASMELRRQGISRKNMFVVPNNIVGQWEKIFTELYPNSVLLTIEPKSFKPEMRSKVLTQMRDGDYDGIIIAYSCFEMIPLSDEFVISEMNNRLQKINDAVNRIDCYGYSFNHRVLEREKNNIKKLTGEFLNNVNSKTSEITFDSLEINTIFLDEAHNFKNIPIQTKMKNLNGINTKGSSKCLDMMRKIRCVQEQNNGRGAVLASGTPLCNSISDAYAIQMYLQYDELEKRNLHIFDNWVKTFSLPEQLCEIDVDTSKYRFIRRFSRFFNLPELSLLFSQIAIFHAMENTDGLPDLNGYDEIIIKKNKALSAYMEKICHRTDAIRAKEVDRHIDNMLKVSTDGRKAALDLTLVGEKQRYDNTSKVKRCADEVVKINNEYPECSQLVFCDYSTPKGENFNVYDELKKHLLLSGFSESEIAFVHSYHTEQRKLELYRKVNEGKIKVIIGSTFKLGIGANVQKKLKAVHHLDVPWRPADMIQREGRILRRGNENRNVKIFRYIAEGSFDAYSWQILETKQRFISQFLNGSAYQRSISDLESNILSYGEVKALALSSPKMKEYAEVENELRGLVILYNKHNTSHTNMLSEINDINDNLKRIAEKTEDAEKNKVYVSTIPKKTFKAAAIQYKNTFSKEFVCGRSDVQMFDFIISPPVLQDEKNPFLMIGRTDIQYAVKIGNSAQGNLRRILNFIKNFDKTIEKLSLEKEKLLKRKNYLESIVKESNPYINKVREYEKRLDMLKAQIQADSDI